MDSACSPKNKQRKERVSALKKAGLKSAIVLDDSKLLLTSFCNDFGSNNAANFEKIIIGNRIIDLSEQVGFNVTEKSSRNKFEISNIPHSVCGILRDFSQPHMHLKRKIGEDDISLKEFIERIIFNTDKEFNDNIHIQICYCIMDIEKILSPFINEITFIANNLVNANNNVDEFDLSLDIHANNNFDSFFNPEYYYKNKGDEKLVRKINASNIKFKRILNSNKIYQHTLSPKKNTDDIDKLKKLYYEYYLIAIARQSLFHGKLKEHSDIYNMDESYDSCIKDELQKTARREARLFLDSLFINRRDDVLRLFGFFAEKMDLLMIFSMYGAYDEKKQMELAKYYFEFVILKRYKYIGISFKKIREYIMYNDELKITKDGYTIHKLCSTSYWHKFTRILNFVIYIYFVSHTNEYLNIMESLRTSKSDDDKDRIYKSASQTIWKTIRTMIMDILLPEMKEGNIQKKYKNIKINWKEIISSYEKYDISYFTKTIYALSLFIPTRRTDELLVRLIEKFEQIQCFNLICEYGNVRTIYSDKYKLFKKSGDIGTELKILRSVINLHDNAKTPVKIDDSIYEAGIALGMTHNNHDFHSKKNFLYKFVTKNDNFQFVLRYLDADAINAINKNTSVIKFVLNEIPDRIINDYYCNITLKWNGDVVNVPASVKRDELMNSIVNFDCSLINQIDQSQPKWSNDKQKVVELLKLYFAIPYLLIKNLIEINSRYSLAFHCFERDYNIVFGKEFNSRRDYQSGECKNLSVKYLNENRMSKKISDSVLENCKKMDGNCVRIFRNNVAHLNVICKLNDFSGELKYIDSYFSLYHYINQRIIMDKYCEDNQKEGVNYVTSFCFNYVAANHKYSKDFLKLLNVPFAYNLPRYKNLTMEELFDKNKMSKQGRIYLCNE